MKFDHHTSKRSLAALATVFATAAFLVQLAMPSAFANHGTRTLDLAPETKTNAVGATHTITATLSATPDALSPIEIDFEVTGPGGVDAADTPLVPDLTCTISNPALICTVSYASAAAGTDTIRGWIDDDKDNSTLAGVDLTEGQDEVATPGSVTETDITDVVSKTWVVAGSPRNIDLEPETATNPSGSVHLVTATVTDVDGLAKSGTVVTFTETGPGTFRNDGSQITVTTDADGVATAEVTTLALETGDQTITASLPTTGGVDECEKLAGNPALSTAGNCSDTVTKTWGVAPPVSDCTITGTVGDDVLEGTDGADIICGLAGNDSITGLGGNDTLRGGQGNDTAKGGAGDDLVRGGAGDDALRGGPGNDTVKGGGGNDNLKGGSGNDALRGGKGTDTCRGGPGVDSIRGCEN